MVVSYRTKELRIIGEVSPLVAQLEAVESIAEKYRRKDAPSASALPSDIHKLIQNIKEEIYSVANIFRTLEIWEREMKGKIEDVAKVIDEALEVSNSENELHSKLLTVNEKASGCKLSLIGRDSPLILNRIEKFVESVPYSVEPLPFFRGHHRTDGGEPIFDATKSVADLEEDIKSCLEHIKSSRADLEKDIDAPKRYLPFEDQHFAMILVFLSILPRDNSLVKKATIHSYCQWALSKPESYQPPARNMILGPERQMELPEDRTYMILEHLRRHDIIHCQYTTHKRVREIEYCLIKPLAREALINLASYHSEFRNSALQICDPLTLRPCLLPANLPGSGRAFVNINHSYLKFSRNKLEEMRQCCVSLMLGRFHDSAKDHHIEIANPEFINWVGSLVQLRCLSLRGISRITEIPSSFGNLGQLRLLDLRACYDLQRLPVDLARLRFLEHLDVSECYFLTHMPKGVESLTELRVLKGFVAGSPQRHDSCQLGELSALSKLRKLSIRMSRDSILEEEQFDKLSCLSSLVSLTITWSVSTSASRNSTAHSNVSAAAASIALTVNERDISPPPNLEKLDIRCIPHSTKPQWFDASKLSKLKRLYIRAGKLNFQSVYASDPTWDSVETIRLRFLPGVLYETELRKAFPKLDRLEVHECNGFRFDPHRIREFRWGSESESESD